MFKNKKIWIFTILLISVLALDYKLQLSRILMDVKHYYKLQELVHENIIFALLLYIIITVVSCVIFVMPGVTYAIIGSILFGPLLGTLACVIGVTIGAGVAFLTSRYFLKDFLKPTIQKNKHLNQLLFLNADKNDFLILMITRLVPIFPYNLQNFAYGITDISFKNYITYSFLFMIPGTAMYTIGTASIINAEKRVMYITITIILTIIVVGLSLYMKQKYVTKLPELNGE